ncbi:uncharacterized protein LOC142335157 isoform X2 [Convolutriloba macropyga]|uniref:uncharacterized protein LOC142335157 isoform X2 n=1 Tax=Convolutriloba macropyga TaxID=536237 RepID=UPI003F526CE6
MMQELYEIDSDPERKKFLDELFAFMQKRGTPVNRIPIMAKQTLDLHLLFKLVVSKGGLVEVINRKLWREITKGLNLPHSITSAAFTLRTQYMKYLYPFECEKHNLSTMEELNAAIDGNRRDSRNIQSPPTSPTSAGAFGMPFHPGFSRPPYGFDAGVNKYGVFGFPGMQGVNPLNFSANQNGLLQAAKSLHSNEERSKFALGVKPNPADIFNQSAIAALRAKFLSSISANQYMSNPASVSLHPSAGPNLPGAAPGASAASLLGQSSAGVASSNYPSAAATAADILSQRVALAQSQQMAVMQALYEQQQLSAIENLQKTMNNNANATNEPKLLENSNPTTDKKDAQLKQSVSNGQKSPSNDNREVSPSIESSSELAQSSSGEEKPRAKRTIGGVESRVNSPPTKRRLIFDPPTLGLKIEPPSNGDEEMNVPSGRDDTAKKASPENVRVQFVQHCSPTEVSLTISVDGKLFEGTLKVQNNNNNNNNSSNNTMSSTPSSSSSNNPSPSFTREQPDTTRNHPPIPGSVPIPSLAVPGFLPIPSTSGSMLSTSTPIAKPSPPKTTNFHNLVSEIAAQSV